MINHTFFARTKKWIFHGEKSLADPDPGVFPKRCPSWPRQAPHGSPVESSTQTVDEISSINVV